MGISVVWIPVLQASQGGQLFNYIQSVTGYLSPPVLSLYLLAILWKRTNEQVGVTSGNFAISNMVSSAVIDALKN